MVQNLSDALTRHQIFIQRYAAGQVSDAFRLISEVAKDIEAQIASKSLTDWQYARAVSMMESIRKLITDSISNVGKQLTINLEEFATYESEFIERAMSGYVTIKMASVPADLAAGLISTKAMELVSGDKVISQTLKQAFVQFSDTAAKEVATAVSAGILASETTPVIARAVRELIDTRTKAQAETLIRTAANFAGSEARAAFYEANSDVLQGERWVSTLDGRTSPTCRARDGKIYPVGQGPRPPAHYNCRSIRVPVVADKYRIPMERTRASMDGQVSAQTTYNSFLKRQSEEFQNEVLGKSRAELFRKGGLSVDRFVDDRGISYTLAELKALEPLAFKKANM